MLLQDKTGTVDCKIWDLSSPGINDFEPLQYVYVDGDVTVFQGSNQLNIKRIRKADEGEYQESDYLPVSSKDIKIMYQELTALVQSFQNPYLKKLASSYFLEDKAFVKKFCFHSAAKSVHHGFVGGLLEHTLSVMKLCDFYTKSYPALNRDLLLTAALFHDIGKVQELSAFPENDYTDDGQLLGHIVIGTMMVADRIKEIPGFPAKTAAELKALHPCAPRRIRVRFPEETGASGGAGIEFRGQYRCEDGDDAGSLKERRGESGLARI